MAGVHKWRITKVVRKIWREGSNIVLLKDDKVRKQLEKLNWMKTELHISGDNSMMGIYGNGDDVSWRTVVVGMGVGEARKMHGWNEEVNKVIARKKEVHKAMCGNSAKRNKSGYEDLRIKAKKVASKQLGKIWKRNLMSFKLYVIKQVKVLIIGFEGVYI